jgi:cation diffusion facilitator family transporter
MPSHEANMRAGRRVAIVGVAASGALACMNIAVGILAHSTSVLATGIEFAGDVLASTIVLGGMVIAARPADSNHPYGHGRVELLAGFVVGLIVMAGGAGIGYQSLQAIGAVHPPPGRIAVVALLTAIGIRGIMSAVKFSVGRRIQSGSLIADAWNDAVDILSAAAALTAVVLTMMDPVRFLAADHYGGFVVGVIVVGIGIRIAREVSFELVDTMPEPGMANQIREIAAGTPGVRFVDKIHARKTGLRYHADLHIQVDGTMTVDASHAIAGHVRAELRRRLPWVADVIIHVEPAADRRTATTGAGS